MAFGSILNSFSIILNALFCIIIATYASSENLFLDNPSVCKLDFDLGVIKLRSDKLSSIVIGGGSYLRDWTGRYDFKCKFFIKTQNINEGIYAVIQNLNFREKVRGECKDFVEMSVPNKDISKFIGRKTKSKKKYCGLISSGMWLSPKYEDEDSYEDIVESLGKVARNAYVAPNGELNVEIYMAADGNRIFEPPTLSIAFTAYKHNCYGHKENLEECRTGECIFSDFFNDGIQHCPFQSCADEKGCEHFTTSDKEIVRSGIGTKVTFGAIAAIILIILKFALCVWLCKHLNRRRVARQQRARDVSTRAEPPVELMLPTAPPIVETDIESEKDLPPAYDTLYPPSQPNVPSNS